MDAMPGFASMFRPFDGFNLNAVFKMSQLTPVMQHHLKNVYTSLAFLLLSLFIGARVATSVFFPSSILSPMVLILASVGVLLYFGSLPAPIPGLRSAGSTPEMEKKRLGWICLFAGLEGAALGLSIPRSDYHLVLQASLATAVIFACFSVSALTAKRRSYLYLGSFLSSALGVLALMGLSSLLLGIRVPFHQSLYLYGGLLVSCGYIIYNTQLIVERSSVGDYDHIGHSLLLFMDIVRIAIRLIRILKDLENKKEKKEGRRC